MSKIFSHEQAPGGPQIIVERGRDGNVYRIAGQPRLPGERPRLSSWQLSQDDVIEGVFGLLVFGGIGLAFYFWHVQIILIGMVLWLWGTFTRSPLVSILGLLAIVAVANRFHLMT